MLLLFATAAAEPLAVDPTTLAERAADLSGVRIRTELSKSGLIDEQRCAAAPDPLSAAVIGLWCGEEAAQLSQRIGCDGVAVLLGPRIRQWHALG